MASVNKVILIGNLGRDPETRYTTGGDAVTNLNIATTETWKDKSGEKQEKTEWHRVVLFARLAEIAGEYLKKGRPVYIEGRLQTRKYTDKDGVEKYATEIVADRMQLLGGREGGGSGGDTEFSGGGGRRESQRAERRRQAAASRAAAARLRRPTISTTTSRSRRIAAVSHSRLRVGGRLADHAAAEANVAVVEHEVLPRRRCPLRRGECRRGSDRRAATRRGTEHPASGNASWRQAPPMTAGPAACRRSNASTARRRPSDRAADGRAPARQSAHCARSPWLRRTRASRAPSRVPPMRSPCRWPERVIRHAVVAADDVAVARLDRAGDSRQVAREEIAKRPLADEADSGRILLRPGRDSLAPGDRTNVALRQFAQRKQHRRQLLLRQLVQEIALVLRRIRRLQQLHAMRRRPARGRNARSRCGRRQGCARDRGRRGT